MKIIFTAILPIFFFTHSYSQVAVSYYPFNSWIAVSSSTEKLLWADFRIETNTFITNLNSELSPSINLRRGEIANYYLGAGANFNLLNSYYNLNILNGYFVTVGSRVKPFQKVRNFSFVFEISPYVNKDFNSGLLRTNLGLSFLFGKLKKYPQSIEEKQE
jgi:hypothetical protein